MGRVPDVKARVRNNDPTPLRKDSEAYSSDASHGDLTFALLHVFP